MAYGINHPIPESEDISYEINVHDKRYEAAFAKNHYLVVTLVQKIVLFGL